MDRHIVDRQLADMCAFGDVAPMPRFGAAAVPMISSLGDSIINTRMS